MFPVKNSKFDDHRLKTATFDDRRRKTARLDDNPPPSLAISLSLSLSPSLSMSLKIPDTLCIFCCFTSAVCKYCDFYRWSSNVAVFRHQPWILRFFASDHEFYNSSPAVSKFSGSSPAIVNVAVLHPGRRQQLFSIFSCNTNWIKITWFMIIFISGIIVNLTQVGSTTDNLNYNTLFSQVNC